MMRHNRKVLVVLGGAEKSLPLVRCAKELGCKIVLIDRNRESACRREADVFCEVSTLDHHKVVEIAQGHGASGIVSFGSDLMALACARAAEALGLPGNPPMAVETMVRKDLFRPFLAANGFATPRHASAADVSECDWSASGMRLPVIVKPSDSAGSAEVRRVENWADLAPAFMLAKNASRCGQVIVEEFITRAHMNLIAGDIFVDDGRIAYFGLLDSHRAAAAAPFLPTGTSYPCSLDQRQVLRIRTELQRLISALGLRSGPVNVELMFGEDDRIYAIELAPRNGGNAIPELLGLAEGVDLVAALVDVSLGVSPAQPWPDFLPNPALDCISNYMIHSPVAGRFSSLSIADEIMPHVRGMVLEVQKGDEVHLFDRAPNAIGTLWFRFDDARRQQDIAARLPDLVQVRLEQE
jgi:biotin carboxylase